uniref:Uncharacterized protein n=1 Tax=Felis catus TaxID=9685 RepID=A0ABI7YWP3_FELCA
MCLFFAVFPGKVQTPGACRRLLCAQQYSIPRSPAPAVSTAFSEEESHGEASFSQTPSSEWDETRLIFAVRQEMKKRARGAPNAAWSCPLLEKSMTKKPIRPSHSHACASRGCRNHRNRHVRIQNQLPSIPGAIMPHLCLVANTGCSRRCAGYVRRLFSVTNPDEKTGGGFMRQSQTISRHGSKKGGLSKIFRLTCRGAMPSSSKWNRFSSMIKSWLSFYIRFSLLGFYYYFLMQKGLT